MKNPNAVLLIAIAVLLVGGCKKDEEEAVLPPPIDTLAIADTASKLAVDTMAVVPEATGLPSVPRGSGYAVQVASTTDEAYALNQVELWKKRGYEPFVSTTIQDNINNYRIRLGLFVTQAEAQKIVDEVADKYSVKGWIDQESN